VKKNWFALSLLLLTCLCAPATASAQQITCQSRNYQQEVCPTGVTITNAWILAQQSRSPCIQGQTWGFQGNSIWVTQGCEADFGFQGVATAPVVVAPSRPGGMRVSCNSRNYQQQFCSTGFPITSAWLIEQTSSAPCIQGQTWGYEGANIGVAQGCAGEFGVQSQGAPSYAPPPPVLPVASSVICESRDYQQSFCPSGRRIGSAWLIAQRSRAPCIQGRSWGFDANGIWVAEGCEGEFGFR
jgi:hypothetical protein